MMSRNKIFGWSWRAWNEPFLQALRDFPTRNDLDILEIGACGISAISLFFGSARNRILITTYPCHFVDDVRRLVDEALVTGPVSATIDVSCMSADKVIGKYDVIIMKSVLGGIFRSGQSSPLDAEKLILKIVNENLKPNGVLITLDNGKTIFERLYANFGARKNRWHYFVKSEFRNASKQYCFGLFSAFSLSTRFKKIGAALDDIIYFIDKCVCIVFKPTKASVIVSVYRRNGSP